VRLTGEMSYGRTATVARKDSMETTETTTGAAGRPLAPERLLGTWMRVAIENGGVLHVVRNRWNYCATMLWPQLPDAEAINGEGKTLDEALEQLESALLDDAANEMVESGAV